MGECRRRISGVGLPGAGPTEVSTKTWRPGWPEKLALGPSSYDCPRCVFYVVSINIVIIIQGIIPSFGENLRSGSYYCLFLFTLVPQSLYFPGDS